ncbi:response regulator transcription factor [Shouchella clausii]
MKRTVLIVDDNHEIAELLQVFLEKEGIRTLAAYNGLEAWSVLMQTPVDLVVLDIMMPGMDGMQLLQRIRERYRLPVIFLSAKSQDEDKINGLRRGADDFIAKPFNPLEVSARVSAMLRRSYEFGFESEQGQRLDVPEDTVLGPLRLSHRECALYKSERAIDLTATEYKLLRVLMASPGRVFTKKQLFEQVWPDPYYKDDNTVMVHISRLREKIESNSRQPTYLLTVRGLGYKFAKPEGSAHAERTT